MVKFGSNAPVWFIVYESTVYPGDKTHTVIIKLMIRKSQKIEGAHVLVLGMTFKEYGITMLPGDREPPVCDYQAVVLAESDGRL